MNDYNPKEYIDELKQKLDNAQQSIDAGFVKWHPFMNPRFEKFHRWWLRLWYRISPRSFLRATIKGKKGHKFFIKPAVTWHGTDCIIGQEIVIDLTALGLEHLKKEEIDKYLGYEAIPYGLTNTKPFTELTLTNKVGNAFDRLE